METPLEKCKRLVDDYAHKFAVAGQFVRGAEDQGQVARND